MTELAVELQNISKQFTGTQGEQVDAVDNLSLQVRQGEFFSLLGPSGCGKTTTLRMIGGFELPTEGEVLIEGVAQGYTPPFQRPVNTVFQNYALFPHMSVFDNVAFGLRMQRLPGQEVQRRTHEALELVQLGALARRKPGQLSGGQSQRVALARALVNRPRVLLLDEPLGALDLKLRKAMQGELKALQQRLGITFIYVTHDQEEALTMSDRIGVMAGGRLLQVGTARDIYEAPATRFVSSFIGETNALEGAVSAIHTDVSVEGYRLDLALIELEGCTLYAEAGPGLVPGVPVSVVFRPEKVSLGQGGADVPAGHNACTATLAEVIYMGAVTAYRAVLPGGQFIEARVQNAQARPEGALTPGMPVHLHWPIRACRAFKEEAQALASSEGGLS